MITYSAYDTTVGMSLEVKKLKLSIEKLIAVDQLSHVSLNLMESEAARPCFLTGYYDRENEIPLFAHPVFVKGMDGHHYLVADIRQYVKKKVDPQRATIEELIKNKMDYEVIRNRMILEMIYRTQPESLKRLSIFPAMIYANWLSGSVTSRFGLDPRETLIMKLCAFQFYHSLFYNDQYTSEMKQSLILDSKKAFPISTDFARSIYDNIQLESEGFKTFIENVKKIIDTPRIQVFNGGVVLTALSTSWFGFKASEIVGVSIEHPPTWIALLYGSITSSTYKRTAIARVAEIYGKKGVADTFIRQLKIRIDDYLKEEQRSALW